MNPIKNYQTPFHPTPIDAYIELPGSKSITNRALLLSALAKGDSILEGILFSDDTQAFMNALIALGVVLTYDKKKAQCFIKGTTGKFPIQKANIWCQDAGTVARFLLAGCAANSTGEYHFSGTPHLQSRPIMALLNALKKQGVEISPSQATHLPFTLTKKNQKLKGGSFFVSGEESSQFLSAILMVAPYAEHAVTIKTDKLISTPYVHLTCQMMQEFGITVTYNEEPENVFFIEAPHYYQGRSYNIEPDLSTASYFFAAAALTNGTVTVPNVNKETCKQGDIAFLDVLEKMGCRIIYESNAVTVQGTNRLRGKTINMSAISDTMMTLACIAPFADSPTTITHIKHVRYKESDRIAAIVNNWRRLGIETQWGDDYITIYPGTPKAGEVDSYDDHRIAMAFALPGLKIPNINIQNMSCVSKTCPDFVHLWEKLLD